MIPYFLEIALKYLHFQQKICMNASTLRHFSYTNPCNIVLAIEDVVEEVLKCHNTSFEIIISVQSLLNFITAENKVVLNSYLVGIVVCQIESIKAIYSFIRIIDFLESIIAILHLSTSSTTIMV